MSIALAGTLAVSLAACGSKDPAGTTGNSTSSSPASTGGAKQDKITITFQNI
ncbi:hypothetical protein [Paenibacillus sp. HJGM_3]|uniref:hypothetical protein n=1 Tax=Paenibacillus sp. HJGM_3 TaxID=3379816 RepID=UPI00385B4940